MQRVDRKKQSSIEDPVHAPLNTCSLTANHGHMILAHRLSSKASPCDIKDSSTANYYPRNAQQLQRAFSNDDRLQAAT
jgi:hypothetical protein